MSNIRVGRLRKLAKHLRGTHHAHKKFNIRKLANGEFAHGEYCGFSGCAIGEFPVLWPKEWSWKPDSEPFWYNMAIIHKSQKRCSTNYNVIAEFFSITREQVVHLFDSTGQMVIKFGGRMLDRYATAEQVADNIDAFIKKVAS